MCRWSTGPTSSSPVKVVPVADEATITHENGSLVCERCEVADTPLRRLRGLIGRSELRTGDGILLRPCGSVHTFLMRFQIDVIFCDADLHVLSVADHVPPRR